MTTTATEPREETRSDLLFEQLLEQVRVEVDTALDAVALDADEARRLAALLSPLAILPPANQAAVTSPQPAHRSAAPVG